MNITEHMAQIKSLAPLEKVTHVAVSNGAWSDSATWKNGQVPDAEASVFIPKGIAVTYDANDKTPLSTVRVAGTLDWATSEDTTMLVETIVTEMGSSLVVGSADGGSVDATASARIVFRDTPIDTRTDPTMLSHGLVAFGEVEIAGATKETYLEIKGNSVKQGATSVALDGDLMNWSVGDTILFVGTGDGSRDETRTIVSVAGNTVTFDKALSYNHQPPAGHDFNTYVGNLTHNVVLTSENPEGTRGHVMLMNHMAKEGEIANSVQYAEFNGLGRTDHSIETGTDSNPTGRYPLHMHETGTDPDSATTLVQGVSVSGSPGWGIVQHSSDATIADSVVYDTVGAGMVSEHGDETGYWLDNLVTTVAKTGMDTDLAGVEGSAYENQSRVIIQQGNIAANSAIGWNFFGIEEFPEDENDRSAPIDGVHREMFERSQVTFDPSPFDVALDHEEPAISNFNNNTSIANGVGLHVFHRQFSDDTDTMSVMRDFTIWGGQDAIALDNYASNYEFIDSVWQGSGVGFSIMRKTSSVVFNDVEMHDFNTGYRSWGVNHEVVLIDTEFHNVADEFDLADLLRNVDSSSLRSELINYYKSKHGIDYTNPMPQIVNSANLTPVDAVTFKADAGADLTIGKGDNGLKITGTITDSVGVRNFNEYVIAKPPNGNGTSKDFEGIDVNLGAISDGRLKEFTLEMFLEQYGVFKKPDGTWVSPVVNWITERLSGDQHPVIIEITVANMTDAELAPYILDAYPTPGVNNTDWYTANQSALSDAGEESGAGEDTTESGASEDTTESGAGEDTTESGFGEDTIESGKQAPTVEAVNFPDPTLVGTQAAENLRGSSSDDVIAGLAGDDLIRGHAGNDWLFGDDGNDTLIGDDGDDTLYGGHGEDTLFGGNGADVFLFDQKTLGGGPDEIKDFSAANGDVIQLRDLVPSDVSAAEIGDYLKIATVGTIGVLQYDATGTGTAFADIVTIRDGAKLDIAEMLESGGLVLPWSTPPETEPADTTEGGSGSDTTAGGEDEQVKEATSFPDPTLVGSDDADNLRGGSGGDVIAGLGGADILRGGVGDDWLFGNAGADTLSGDSGNDTLFGGAGEDKLFGNDGADTFLFNSVSLDGAVDEIKDFSAAEGDVIQLLDLVPTDVNLADIAGYLQIVQLGTVGYLQYDESGVGTGFRDIALIRNGGQFIVEDMIDSGELVLSTTEDFLL